MLVQYFVKMIVGLFVVDVSLLVIRIGLRWGDCKMSLFGCVIENGVLDYVIWLDFEIGDYGYGDVGLIV